MSRTTHGNTDDDVARDKVLIDVLKKSGTFSVEDMMRHLGLRGDAGKRRAQRILTHFHEEGFLMRTIDPESPQRRYLYRIVTEELVVEPRFHPRRGEKKEKLKERNIKGVLRHRIRRAETHLARRQSRLAKIYERFYRDGPPTERLNQIYFQTKEEDILKILLEHTKLETSANGGGPLDYEGDFYWYLTHNTLKIIEYGLPADRIEISGIVNLKRIRQEWSKLAGITL